MTTKQKISSESDSSGPVRPESSVEDARERLAGLLPADALEDALTGLEADEITGPGGLVAQLAAQAEVSYKRLVTDQQAGAPARKGGRERDTGARMK